MKVRELLEDVMPFGPTDKFARIYGNYCGKGNRGGPPIDDLDAICMDHDRCYHTADGNHGPKGACDLDLLKRTQEFLTRPNLTLKQKVVAKSMLVYFQRRQKQFTKPAN